MTRNIAPTEGGPSGGQLEAKIGAYYMLAMLCESEARGLPSAVARLVKFQRGYEPAELCGTHPRWYVRCTSRRSGGEGQ
jgi:hypothetical protein